MRILLLILLAVQLCLAQNPALQSYTWKSKTQVEVNGEVRKVTLDQVRYDASGQVQKTPLAAPDASSQPQPRGPIAQRLAQRKAEKAQDWVEGLRSTLEAYQHVPKDKLKTFMMGGKITPMGGGIIQIQNSGLVTPGDQVTVTADMASKEPKSFMVNTTYDNAPLQMQVELSDVAPGVNAPTKVTISVPDHNLDVVTDNYDYQPL
jgi:hypothetical protein